jgi:hypothetical protein
MTVHKTKSPIQSRQCHTTIKSEPEQISTLIGLVNLEMGIPVSESYTAQSGEAFRVSNADVQTNQLIMIGSLQNRLSLSESFAKLRENPVVNSAGGSPENSGDCRVGVSLPPKMPFAHSLISLLPRPNIFLQIVVKDVCCMLLQRWDEFHGQQNYGNDDYQKYPSAHRLSLWCSVSGEKQEHTESNCDNYDQNWLPQSDHLTAPSGIQLSAFGFNTTFP